MATEGEGNEENDGSDGRKTPRRAAKKTAQKSSSKRSASKRAPAKRSSSKESTSKRAPAKRSSSKKSTSKRAPSKRSSSERSDSEEPSDTTGGRSDGQGASSVAERAARQLVELAGREMEAVTGLRRSDDGWTVQIEVVEVRRVPNTTDVLALYEVEVDGQGDLLGYRRVRRYVRGTPSEE
jgi:hypothetical protein